MVTDAPRADSQISSEPIQSGTPTESLSEQRDAVAHSVEEIVREGAEERLGVFPRISSLSVLIILTLFFMAISSYKLLKIATADQLWQDIMSSSKPFPNITSTKFRKHPFFEGKLINGTNIGKMFKEREKWYKNRTDFGLQRFTVETFPGAICLLCLFGLGTIHLLLTCIFQRFRRKFLWISLGYSFVGLITCVLCFTTLYYSFLRKVSSYLENARIPPNSSNNARMRDLVEADVAGFVDLCLACAFAYSKPNIFASNYPRNISQLSSCFTVNGTTYTRDDLQHLGICPVQGLVLLSVLLLAVTTGLCWVVASVSEILENQILGPPVWMKRFKINVRKGIRHWRTRSMIPSFIDASDSEREDTHDGNERKTRIDESAVGELLESKRSPSLDDAYCILDGGLNHAILMDPLNDKPCSKYYHHEQLLTN